MRFNLKKIGAWRSLVARLPWAQEVPGSNPGAPTSVPIRFQDEGEILIRSSHDWTSTHRFETGLESAANCCRNHRPQATDRARSRPAKDLVVADDIRFLPLPPCAP